MDISHAGRSHWYRQDLQGLRAVAVLLVLSYHAGVPWLGGGFLGVDVFFTLSGFVVTQLLLLRMTAPVPLAIASFWRGRVARLVPAATLVVVVTLVVGRAVLPPLQWRALTVEALAAVLGGENVLLAQRGVDYLASTAPGPFDQFWSLGVEAQFYVVWPVVVAVLHRRTLRQQLGGMALIGTASVLTIFIGHGEHASWTFFGTHSRVSEFVSGALVALLAVRGWGLRSTVALGVARLAGCALVATVVAVQGGPGPWPGPLAAVVALGVVLVLVPAAPAVRQDPVTRLLSSRAAGLLGSASYSIYLWHWPVLVLPSLALGRDLDGSARLWLAATALALGVVSERFVERPLRRVLGLVGRRALVPAAVAMVPVVVVGAVGLTLRPTRWASERRVEPPTPARVLAGPRATPFVPADAVPTLPDADADRPRSYEDGCSASITEVRARPCAYVEGRGGGTIVLFGDSHASQWLEALVPIAEAARMRLVLLSKSSCPAAIVPVRDDRLGRAYTECDQWRRGALARIRALDPAIVIVGEATEGYADRILGGRDARRAWQDGREALLEQFPSSSRVLMLQDTPWWPDKPNDCVSRDVEDIRPCLRPVRVLTDPAVRRDLGAFAQRHTDRVGIVDPVPWLCSSTCSPVLWNVVVYRDENHITDAAARMLRPSFHRALRRDLVSSIDILRR